MKSLIIAGNWKSNKTIDEAEVWMAAFKAVWDTNITVILCVPYTLLGYFAAKKPQFLIGAQDVSHLPPGAYTGEINAMQLKELAQWVIIGHSERRNHLGETDEILAKKVIQAKDAGLKVIYCVPNDSTSIPKGVDVVAYEPVWAIGTGKSDTPENANAIIEKIKAKSQLSAVLYGGSVTAANVASFVSQPSIDGVLPGGASLDPEKFAELIASAR